MGLYLKLIWHDTCCSRNVEYIAHIGIFIEYNITHYIVEQHARVRMHA